MKRIAWAILGWSALLVAQAASFDCAKASSKIEKMICGDEKLSKLDEELNTAYKNVLKDESQSEAIRQTQKNWMKERNGCLDSTCVNLVYQNRVFELTSTSNSSAANSSGHRSIICPHCGTWNIFQADVVMPKHTSVAELWDGPIGETLFVDNKSIAIPDCGSFTYKTTLSKIKNEGGTKYHNIAMQLTKIVGSKYLPQCDSSDWMLSIEIDDNEIDDGGWGGAYFVLDNSAGKQLRLRGWIPERRDLNDFGSNGEGLLASFQIDHATKKLSAILNKIDAKYKAHITAPFDLDLFHDNAQEYCEKQYVDTPGNPSVSAREQECELNIYNAKFQELESWKCESNRSSNTKSSPCKLPTEAIDESKDYTNP